MTADVPRGPSSRIWTTLRVMRDPYAFYEDARRRYGDTFQLKAWNGDLFVTGDPAVVRDLFKADSTKTKPFRADAFAPLLGRESLLLLWGVRHREERKLLSPPFHGHRTRAWAEVMRATTERRIAGWQDGDTIVAADELLDLSLEIIVRAVFGIDEDTARWLVAVKELVSRIEPLFLFFPALQRLPIGPWRRFVAARDQLDGLLYDEIRRRRAAGLRGEDILSTLLDARFEDGGGMSDEHVRDELVTLLFAGHETTQIAMAWMLYHLARAPGALARLRAELDGCDGSAEAMAKLPYLDAVASETLRMTPIVPDMLRTLAEPMQLGPYLLPAGTHVAFVAAMVHTRPDLYPDPHLFRPERFLERRFGPHEWIPFGGGARRCIGAAFATVEMKVVVATILRQFEIESVRDEVPVRRNATMGTKHGVPLRVRRRGAAAGYRAA